MRNNVQQPQRFSDAYRQAMETVTVSPQLQERIRQLENTPPKSARPRILSICATAAACLIVVLAAGRLLPFLSADSSTEAAMMDEAYTGGYDAGTEGATETAATIEEAVADEAEEAPEGRTAAAIEPYVLGSATAPVDEKEEMADEEEDAEAESAAVAAASPITVCASLEEAEALLGWSTDFCPEEAFTVCLIGGECLQLSWEGGWYRQAPEALGTDISGDYTDYPFVSETADGSCKGDSEDAIRLILWQQDGYSRAYYTDTPLSAEEAAQRMGTAGE